MPSHVSPSDLILEREVTHHHIPTYVTTYHLVGPHHRARCDTSPHVNIRHHMSSRRTSSSGARGAWLAARCFYFSTYRPPSAKCDAPTIEPPKKDNNNNKNFSTSPREARRRRARANAPPTRDSRANVSHRRWNLTAARNTHRHTHRRVRHPPREARARGHARAATRTLMLRLARRGAWNRRRGSNHRHGTARRAATRTSSRSARVRRARRSRTARARAKRRAKHTSNTSARRSTCNRRVKPPCNRQTHLQQHLGSQVRRRRSLHGGYMAVTARVCTRTSTRRSMADCCRHNRM